MKLNLLPTHVGKEKQIKLAVVLSVLILAAGIAGAIFMVIVPKNRLADLKDQIDTERRTYDALVRKAASANDIIQKAQTLIRNINLANAMIKHSTEYPDLYDDVLKYVPSFFRVSSLTSQPATPDTSVVTMVGVLKTYQQYADLMLALLKNPNVVSVTRAGYTHTEPNVPPLTEQDQKGRPIRPGETPLPDDPLARLDALIAQGRVTGFTGTGGFGTADTGARGAMPDWSQITLTLVVKKGTMTPDPQATLASGGGAGAAGGGAGRGGGPGG